VLSVGTAVLIEIIFQAAWRPERMENKDGTETRWLFWICANWPCGKTDRGVVWAMSSSPSWIEFGVRRVLWGTRPTGL